MDKENLPLFGNFGALSAEATNNNRNIPAPDAEDSPVQDTIAEAPSAPASKPASAKTTAKNGNKKAANTAKKKTEVVMVYLTPEEKEEIFMAAHKMKISMTTLMENAAVDAVRYTVECTDPNCRCIFTQRRVDGEAPLSALKSCPLCGGKVASKP